MLTLTFYNNFELESGEGHGKAERTGSGRGDGVAAAGARNNFRSPGHTYKYTTLVKMNVFDARPLADVRRLANFRVDFSSRLGNKVDRRLDFLVD